MRPFLLRRAGLLAGAGLIALCLSTRADADTVLPGWDLFQTDATQTMFDGVNFGGVPLGTSFTFPPTNPEGNPIIPPNPNLGPTDTIIERLGTATAAAGGSATISILIQALQLETTAPVPANTFGAGTPAGNYFITLSATAAQAPGSMTINFANPTLGPPPPPQPIGGTFTSSLPIAFDLHSGALNGPVVLSNSLTLTSSTTEWSHFPAPGTVQVVNVNSFLNTADHLNDFFIIGSVTETEPGARHVAFETGTVPEPTTIVSGGIGLIFGALLIRWSRRRAA